MLGFILGISIMINIFFIVVGIIIYKKISKLGILNSRECDLSSIFNMGDNDFNLNDKDFED